MKNNNITNPDDKKPSVVWKVIKNFLSIIFPIFKMMALNRLLKTAERTLGKIKDEKGKYIDPYGFLPRQRRKNLILGLVASVPLVLGILCSYLAISTNSSLNKGYSAIKRDVSGFHLIEATKKVIIVVKIINIDAEAHHDFMFGIYTLLAGLGFSTLTGYLIVKKHPILVDTEKLKNHLAKSGYVNLDENPTVLATPIGVLIDITGNTPREIADSDRVWIPLNVKVNKDWSENPDRRSLVFFKFSYELKKGGEYGYTKIPENT